MLLGKRGNIARGARDNNAHCRQEQTRPGRPTFNNNNPSTVEGDFIKINNWLLPFSLVYGFGVWFRNLLFDLNVLKSKTFKIPVIAVGNITVGGAGKTPHVEYLVRLLRERVRVAVLSRGYKRQTRGYVLASEATTAAQIGDEPYQMYRKYGSDTYVAVDANRCEGIERLQHDAATCDTDVVLLDDAYQHRYVKPGVNILLVDYHRLIVYDRLLPAGRLREPQDGKHRADVVIVTKCPRDLRPMDYLVLRKAMALRPYQKIFFTTLRYCPLTAVFPEGKKFSSTDITAEHNVVVLTGIASPQHLIADLQAHTQHITPLTFADHHCFTPRDVARINNTFDALPPRRVVITTEKDAARLVATDGLSADVRRNTYALPVEIEFMLNEGEQFDEYIITRCAREVKSEK